MFEWNHEIGKHAVDFLTLPVAALVSRNQQPFTITTFIFHDALTVISEDK